jgi:hypothetical protein
MQHSSIHLRITSRGLQRLLIIIFVLNIFFLLATVFVHDVYMDWVQHEAFLQIPSISLIVDEFNLGNENNLAAWYSSMLLITVGIVALSCYWIDAEGTSARVPIKMGWLFISFFFVFLSLDELGSLHENAGKLSQLDVMGDSSWESVILVPGTIVLAFMSVFFWITLRKHPVVILLLCVGAAFFI